MQLLSPLVAQDLSKSYGDNTVLDGVDLIANPGRPLGVVGENGVGKSTLLRLLAGVEPADAGSVELPADIGYLGQTTSFDLTWTIGDVLADALASHHQAVARLERLAAELSSGDSSSKGETVANEYANTLAWAELHQAWDATRRAELAAARLGLASFGGDRQVATMSGGERSRLALAALITRRPACVLLDEPTNHLDDTAMEFLEDYLLDLPGVVVVASHDRVLLDRVCAVVVDLDVSHFGVDGQGGNRFAGGYTAYLDAKRAARRRWEEAFLAQRDELNALRLAAKTTARQVAHNRPPRDSDKFIYNFKGARVQSTISRRVRDAEQRIAVIERDQIPKPPRELSFDTSLTATAASAAATVLMRDAVIDGRLQLARLDVNAGDHLLITGANGSGKSTLLSLVAGQLRADAGTVAVSARRIGLLPQDVRFGRQDRTPQQLFEELAPAAAVEFDDLGLLHPRDVSRPVGVLSVGQQRRVALAILVGRTPDLLLLDEPTNHISLTLADELEDALNHSPDTVMVASHDRWIRSRWSGAELALVSPASSGIAALRHGRGPG